MAGIALQCRQPGVEEIFNHLKDLGYAQQLDASYRILNYEDPSNPIGKLEEKEAKNGKVVKR